MNAFNRMVAQVRENLPKNGDVRIVVGEPVDRRGGVWTLGAYLRDGFTVEVEWTQYRGFGLSAGWQLDFGLGVDEVIGDAGAAADRIIQLVAQPEPTSREGPMALGQLRRMVGIQQNAMAAALGMTKAQLAQLEKPHAVVSMRLATLRRIADGLGGELDVRVRFPGDVSRRVLIE